MMKLPRRQILHLAAGAAALPVVSRVARAQAYPARPVRIVVGFPAGGGTDIVARLIGQWLSERLGQSFIIDNRPGANTIVATEAVARAQGDGYTLLTVGPGTAINSTLYDKLNYNLARDFVMVAGLNYSPLVLEVNPAVPPNSVAELIAYAKANPGKMSMASFGTGSISHLAGELFKMTSGVDMVHVPYRGGAPAVTDLIGGQVQVYFDNLPGSIEYIKSGKVRAMAVTTTSRWPELANVPALAEFLPGYQASVFFGVAAPKKTSPEIIDKLNKEINAGLDNPKIKARLADLGAAPLVLSPAAFGKLIADETERWGKVIRTTGIKPE
jgi:tripartite-type tricarboxylate transporter receptor subunit TctC